MNTDPAASATHSEGSRDHPTSIRRPSLVRRVWRGIKLFVLLPYLCLLLLLTICQRSLLYPAAQVSSLSASTLTHFAPGSVEDVDLLTRDGVTIRGWLFLADRHGSSDTRPPLLIHFHGNAGHRGDRVTDAREFLQHGVDVLLMDYRGYGDSEGSPSRQGLIEDARAVWGFAIEQLDRSPDEIILYGESLGGAVAVELAQESCLRGEPPACLMLSATFAHLPDTVQRLYRLFPVRWLLLDRFCSRSRIPQVCCPVIQIHGELDTLITLEEGRELFDAAPAVSACGFEKRFVVVSGADHNGIPISHAGRELARFLAQRQELLRNRATQAMFTESGESSATAGGVE